MLGSILVRVAFGTVLLAAGSYYYSFRKRSLESLTVARYAYLGTVMLVLSYSALLMYFILTHQFQYTYVWNYSSTNLPTPLLISTFYAGQEGSFSLWALYTTIIGIFLMQYTSRKGYETPVMFIWSLVLVATGVVILFV